MLTTSFYASSFSILLMYGCGQNSSSGSATAPATTETKAATTTKPVATANLAAASTADLPTCTEEIKGQLAYVIGDNAFQYCKDGTDWTKIDISTQVPTPEAAPEPERIVSSIYCTASITDANNEPVSIYYNAAIMTSGDVYANGTISHPAGDFSGSEFYSTKQVGAASGAVIIGADGIGTDNFGYWVLSVDKDLKLEAQYKDQDVSGGSQTMTFDTCKVSEY